MKLLFRRWGTFKASLAKKHKRLNKVQVSLNEHTVTPQKLTDATEPTTFLNVFAIYSYSSYALFFFYQKRSLVTCAPQTESLRLDN